MRKIIGIGETVFDIIFRNEQPTAGVPGGSTFNALISLGRTLGVRHPEHPIFMITEAGNDHIGDITLKFMRDNHVMTDGVSRSLGKSHLSLAFLNEQSDAQYEFYKDHKSVHLSTEQIEKINGVSSNDLILFGSFFAINPV
ncbi:MAG: carbohydrate kinase family protein, partial [Bacteroidales bacterium]|nr:carbohydrate kinase family protein [Bacteroidales bacterium]